MVLCCAAAACSPAGSGSDGGRGDGDGAGGEDDGGVTDCDFDPSAQWSVLGEVLQMTSDDGRTCVRLEREDLCPEGWICKAHPFKLQYIRIGHDGTVVEQDDDAKLSWQETHHNWLDVGTAEIEGTTYRLEGEEYGNAYNLTATSQQQWGPVLLRPWTP